MFRSLSPGQIGIRNTTLQQGVVLACDGGFEGLDIDIKQVAELSAADGTSAVKGLFQNAGLRIGAWGLPVNWRQDTQWESDLAQLPRLAKLGRDLGATRVTTWMLPFSDERPFAESFVWHANRFRPIAQVLADHGCSLGIEFIGPKTLRSGHRYEFISTMGGLLDLARAIGTGNVGLLLDAFHLYTSGGEISDLDQITAKDVVHVHVNDAIAGVARDEQLDQVRALPTETGVLDLAGFLQHLERLGYDGPVTPEPFSKRLVDLAATDPAGAVREAARFMDAMWRAAGFSSATSTS